jgi:L-lactate dehydrogenase complex protein LldG
MEESTTREKILKRIRNALISRSPNPFPDVDVAAPVMKKSGDSLDVIFAEEFSVVGGKFIYCENNADVYENLSLLVNVEHFKPVFCSDPLIFEQLLEHEIPVENDPAFLTQVRAIITPCEFLIARTGSIMASSLSGPGRKMNIFAEAHIVIARASQLVYELKDAFNAIQAKYQKRLPSMINVITGPSRTADIEKTLVMGAHGPRDLYVFLIDDLVENE